MLRHICAFTLVFIVSKASAGNVLSFGDWSVSGDGSGWAEVMWESTETVAGFQFDVVGVSLTSVDGGMTEKLDWMIEHNTTRVLGVSLNPASHIPPQQEPAHLLTIYFQNAGEEISFDGVIFADDQAKMIEVDSSDIIIVTTPCPADLNGDNFVNVVDLLEVVGTWGQSGVPSDINGDGIVNVSDLLAVVDAWGPC